MHKVDESGASFVDATQYSNDDNNGEYLSAVNNNDYLKVVEANDDSK